MNNERTERIKQLEKITHMVGDKLMDYLQDRGLVADCAVTIEDVPDCDLRKAIARTLIIARQGASSVKVVAE